MSGRCEHSGAKRSKCPDCGHALYTYGYEHPAVTSDIVVFTLRRDQKTPGLCLLLIRRGEEPFKGKWALPGGFLLPNETIDQCAARELKEETGVTSSFLTQLCVFSTPKRDPRQRVVTVPYLAVVALNEGLQESARAGSDAAEAKWIALDRLKECEPLAFDHREIINQALSALSDQIKQPDIYRVLLHDAFSLGDLKETHDAVAEAISVAMSPRTKIEPADKGNLRKLLGRWIDEKTVRPGASPARRDALEGSRPGPKTSVWFRFVRNPAKSGSSS